MAFIQKIDGAKGSAYKVHYTDPVTGKRRCKSHARYKDALVFKDSPKVTGTRTTIAATMTAAVDHWLAVCEHRGRKGRLPVARNTLRPYRLHACFIREAVIEYEGERIAFGDILLAKLTKGHCEAFRDLLTRTFSWTYARKHLVSFKSAMEQARCDDLMAHQPAEFVHMKQSAREANFSLEDDNKVPDLTEIRQLLKTLRERVYVSDRRIRRARRRYKLIFETIAYGGTRPGEALGLSWDEVYFDRGGIRITQDVDDDGTIDKLKSKAAYRFIFMPDCYMRQLRRWRKLCPPSAHNLVFPNWSGKVDFLGNLNSRGWQPALRDAGLVDENGRHKYPPKSLRHARATLEIHNNANAKEIQRLMGHSSIKVTYDIYGHLFEAHNKERQNRANKIAHDLGQLIFSA